MNKMDGADMGLHGVFLFYLLLLIAFAAYLVNGVMDLNLDFWLRSSIAFGIGIVGAFMVTMGAAFMDEVDTLWFWGRPQDVNE